MNNIGDKIKAQNHQDKLQTTERMEITESTTNIPIYKLVNRRWKSLPDKGDDVTIKDPKLKQGYLGDLNNKTVIELEEIYQRNEQLLNNKSLLSKLKDKGKRLQSQQREIDDALEKAREKEKSTKAIRHESDIHGFEWTGSLTNNTINSVEGKDDIDIDDDNKELDPLRLMANHSKDVEPHERRISRMNEEEDDPLNAIAKELGQLDIKDSEYAANSQEVPTFGTKRDQMLQEKYVHNGPAKISFKPFRPVRNPRPLPGIFVKPKPVKLKPVICISQHEAQKLEKDFLDKEKKREVNHMVKGLHRPKDELGETSSAFTKYRDTNIAKHILDSDDEAGEDEEAFDTFVNGIYDDEDDNEYS